MEESMVFELDLLKDENQILHTQKDMYLKDKQVQTKYGILTGISSFDWFDNSNIKDCQVNEEIIINTTGGKLIPGYQNEGVRNKYIKSLAFYESGNIKKVALHEQTIINTLAGAFAAELITFYESENVKRIFPLNGKITGYWTEENEYELAVPMKIKLPFGEFESKIIGIHLYESGGFKSITLWPKELLRLQYANTVYGVRYGVSFYPGGSIKSLEPAYPIRVKTPIGEITAFNVNAIGINGDLNSLQFYEDGSIKALMTSMDVIHVRINIQTPHLSADLELPMGASGNDNISPINDKNTEYTIKPGLKNSMLDDDAMDLIPVYIEFRGYEVEIRNEENYMFDIRYCNIEISNNAFIPTSNCSSCANCNGCS